MAQSEYFHGSEADEKERIDRIERLDKRLSESLILVQGFEKRILLLERNAQEFQLSLAKINNSMLAVKDSINSIEEKLDLLSNIASDVESHSLGMNQINERISKQSALLSQSSLAYSEQMAQLKSQLQSMAVQPKIDAHKNEVSLYMNELKDRVSSVYQRVLGFEETNSKAMSALSFSDRKIQDITKACSDISSKQIDINLVIESVKSAQESLKESFNKKIDSMQNSLKISLEKTIQEKMPNIDFNSVVNAVKEQMKRDIELITTDVSNASLKYNNISSEVVLIGKKIENLYLQIRKLEIAKAT